MKILGIDPATKTGVAFWDTEQDKIYTYPSDTRNTMKPETDVKVLDSFLRFTCNGVPDFVIMEHPFLGVYDPKNPKQSITGYNTHIKIVHYWEQVIFKSLGRRFRIEKSDNINIKTKARMLYPRTWKTIIFKGITVSGGDKVKSKFAALRKWDSLPDDLSSDEYDACCLCLYQWLLCRDLGVSDLSGPRQRLFEKMRQGGWILADMDEHKHIKGDPE